MIKIVHKWVIYSESIVSGIYFKLASILNSSCSNFLRFYCISYVNYPYVELLFFFDFLDVNEHDIIIFSSFVVL